MIFFVIAALLLDIRRRYHAEFINPRQRWQREQFIRSEEQRHVIPLVETSPPPYDEAVQMPSSAMSPRIETRRMSV
jgi:hypothetical protein